MAPFVRVVVAAVGVVLAGCGGGREELSREEYLKRANAICEEGSTELEAASKDVFADIPEGEVPSQERFEEYARETVIPLVREQVSELRDLPPPEGGAKQVEEIYDAIDEALDKLDRDPTLLSSGGGDLFAEADALSQKYGYEICTGG